MRKTVLFKSLVASAIAASVIAGSVVYAGSSVAAPSTTSTKAEAGASATDIAPQAVVNLGLSRHQARGVQTWLSDFWGYKGPIDGYLGTGSWKAFQRHLSIPEHGYNGPIDGVVGPGTVKALQRKLRAWGYKGAIDGVAGAGTKAAFERFANPLAN